MARPSEFTQEIADTICQQLAEGNSLRSICRADDMPDKSTVLRWLLDPARAAFCDQYTRARELQADVHVDEMPDIADDGSNDYVTKTNADGSTYEQVNSEHIQRSRLTLAHELGVRPPLYFVVLQCVVADARYAVGDEIPINPSYNGTSGSEALSIVPDATTSIYVLVKAVYALFGRIVAPLLRVLCPIGDW